MRHVIRVVEIEYMIDKTKEGIDEIIESFEERMDTAAYRFAKRLDIDVLTSSRYVQENET